MDLKSTYNKIAKDWMEGHRGDTWWIEGTDRYLSFFKPGASILDIGCGAGEKSKYLVEQGLDVTGVDFSEEMIALAKERVPAGRFFVKDIRQPLGFEESFDGVFAQAILLHIPKKDVTETLKNITAPLKAEGYLYVAVKGSRVGKPDEEIVKENDYGYDYERFFSRFTLAEMTGHLVKTGMRIVCENVTTSGKTDWIQVIARKG